jgi:hypothetical protein
MPAKETITRLNEDAVRTQAYLMWEADGRPLGRAEHYWHLAVTEIVAKGSAADKPKRRAAASSGVAERTAAPRAAGKKSLKAKPKKK